MSWVTGTWISVRPPAIKSGWSASAPATTRSAPPSGWIFSTVSTIWRAKCPIMSGWPASGTASVWPGVSSWNCCLEQRADVGIRPYRCARQGGRPQGSPLRVGAAQRSCRGGLYGRPFLSEPEGPEREYPRQRADVGIRPYRRARQGGRPQGAPLRVGAARCSCRGGLCGRPYRQSSPSRSSKARLDSSAFLFRLPLTR